MKRILIIEDDISIQRGLTDALTAEHFDVHVSGDGDEGLKIAQQKKLDLVILDIMLPGMNGFDICKNLRAHGAEIPILMLTGKGEEMDRVLGLELGADDYLTKPFSIRELVARVKALLRRQTHLEQSIEETSFGSIHIDFTKQEARNGSHALQMTSREYDLLKYLISHEGEVVQRSDLLDKIWGYNAVPSTRTVDNFILNIRKKIESNPSKPKHLLTVHTSGYKFVR
jgi:DNA-binding response OmpR family regulator